MATPENDFCFDDLRGSTGTTVPTGPSWTWWTGRCSAIPPGQNHAVGSAHGRLQRLGLAKLDWPVVRDMTMIESATFWKDAPEIETGAIVTERCPTEVSSCGCLARGEVGDLHQYPTTAAMAGPGGGADRDQRSELWSSITSAGG